MFRKMYQGGSSRKQGPRLAMRDVDDEPPRDAPVRLRESWIRGYPDSRIISFGRTVGL